MRYFIVATFMLAVLATPFSMEIPFIGEDWISGYMSTGNPGDFHFYVLFRSRNKDPNAPLIIWLNGGPGCSSAYGLYIENGPVFIDRETHKFIYNNHSWNTFADIIFVDQPTGVGYSLVKSDDEICRNEICVGRNFYTAFVDFLEKHPEYKKRDLYFSGESYAGHYIPAIAAYFAKAGNPDINLKGAAIGNPMTHLSLQLQWYPYFMLENEKFNFFEYLLARLMAAFCYIADAIGMGPTYILDVCDFSFGGLVKLKNVYDIRDEKGYGDLDKMVEDLLNDKEVQKGFGVDLGNKKFEICDMKINRLMGLDVALSQTHDLEYLIENGFEIMLYFGDKDYICNWRGGEILSNNLKWSEIKSYKAAPTKKWSTSKKEVGTYKKYKNYNLLTVYEAGHMVPLDQPEASLEMIRKFINREFQ